MVRVCSATSTGGSALAAAAAAAAAEAAGAVAVASFIARSFSARARSWSLSNASNSPMRRVRSVEAGGTVAAADSLPSARAALGTAASSASPGSRSCDRCSRCCERSAAMEREEEAPGEEHGDSCVEPVEPRRADSLLERSEAPPPAMAIRRCTDSVSRRGGVLAAQCDEIDGGGEMPLFMTTGVVSITGRELRGASEEERCDDIDGGGEMLRGITIGAAGRGRAITCPFVALLLGEERCDEIDGGGVMPREVDSGVGICLLPLTPPPCPIGCAGDGRCADIASGGAMGLGICKRRVAWPATDCAMYLSPALPTVSHTQPTRFSSWLRSVELQVGQVRPLFGVLSEG